MTPACLGNSRLWQDYRSSPHQKPKSIQSFLDEYIIEGHIPASRESQGTAFYRCYLFLFPWTPKVELPRRILSENCVQRIDELAVLFCALPGPLFLASSYDHSQLQLPSTVHLRRRCLRPFSAGQPWLWNPTPSPPHCSNDSSAHLAPMLWDGLRPDPATSSSGVPDPGQQWSEISFFSSALESTKHINRR